MTAARALAYAGLTLTMALWAGNAVIARGYAAEVPPLALSFWRWCLAFVLIAPLGVPRLWGSRAALQRHWPQLVLLGILSAGLYNSLLYVAAQTTGALNITLINATMPVMITLLALPLLGQRPSREQALGIGLGLLGVVLIVARGDPARLLALELQPGDPVMGLAVLCWGLFSVLLRRTQSGLDALAFLTLQVAVGAAFTFPLYLVEAAWVARLTVPHQAPWVFAYVALGPGLIAYGAFNHGVARVGPARAALFFYLIPVFGAALAVPFLGERLQGYHVAGAALVFAALWLATRPDRRG